MSGQLNLALPSGGSVTVAAPDSASDTTVTLPAGDCTLISNKTAGTVLQVVSTYTTSPTTTTSATFVTTGFSLSITPTSTTSKILVRFSGSLGTSSTAGGALTAVYRNSTHISQRFVAYASGGSTYAVDCHEVLDSPATTTPVTYTLYFANQNGSGATTTHNVQVSGYTDYAYVTLMEIAA